MKDDIRKQTCIIIRKNGEYLVGRIVFSEVLRWTIDAHEAWRTRNRKHAEAVARATGGVMVLFNPIVRQMRLI